MNKLVLRNSSIVINDYNLGDIPRLESYFTIFDRITYTKSYKGMMYDEVNRRLFLPRGLDVYFIKKFVESEPVREYNSDPFFPTSEILIKYLPRDDVQKEALAFILGKGEYYSNQNATQLSVNLPTGKGKTYVTIAALTYWRARTIVIASTTGWLDQWKNCMGEYTNIDENREVLVLNGSVAIHKVLNGITDVTKYKVFLVTHSTLQSFGNTNGWHTIGELFKKLQVQLKVYDEAHLNFDNICYVDYSTNTRKTLYLTATPGRSDETENFIYKLYFKNIPAINLFDEDSDPHTRYTALRFNSRPTPQDMRECSNQAYGLNRNAYVNHIVCNNSFYDMMYIVMDKVIKIDGKVLIYIATNSAIDIVKAWIEENYPEFKDNIGVYTSLTPKDIKHEQLSKKLILSTTKSAGAALDIRDLKATIVLAEPFKSEILAKQVLGRTRNDNTDCIEVVDDGFRQISRFYNAKKPIFNKYATECREIKIPFQTLQDKADELYKVRENVKWQYDQGFGMISYDPKFNKSDFQKDE